MKKHTQKEWDALQMSRKATERKIKKLNGYQRYGRHEEDEIVGCGIGKEAFGPMKGSFGIFTFYRTPEGVEYYKFTNPPS